MSVTVTTDRTADLVKAIEELTQTRVLIGIPAAAPARTPEPGGPNPPTNALIGYLNEFGSPEMNIPPRPHLVPGVEAAMPQIVPRLKKAGQLALEGKKTDVQAQFQAVGLLAASSVRVYITDAAFVPLAPRTLAKRRARGRSGEKPLQDTGQLTRAYTYVIVKQKK